MLIALVRGGATEIDDEDAYLSRGRWWLDSNGYVVGYLESTKRVVKLHRVVLGLEDPKEHCDHINRDPLDNRRRNLRKVTNAQNRQNLDPYASNRSGYRGVYWSKSKQRWIAECRLNGKNHTLGRFRDVRDAANAAARFRAEHMPFSEDAAPLQVESRPSARVDGSRRNNECTAPKDSIPPSRRST